MAIIIEEIAKISVLGSVFLMISLTFLPCFVNDVLKYGNLITKKNELV